MATKQTEEMVNDLAVKSEAKKAAVKEVRKFGKQETKEIEGIEYTFQFPGTLRTQQILDNAKRSGVGISDTVYFESIMKEVIIAPKTDWDYWDENLGYGEVMRQADLFLGRTLK